MVDRVLTWVYEEIEQGKLKPGDKFPSQPDIIEKFGITERDVMWLWKQLQRDGIVQVNPNHTVVLASARAAGNRVTYTWYDAMAGAGSARWESACADADRVGRTGPVAVDRVLASSEPAARLCVDAGCELVRRTRILWLDGAPAVVREAWWPAYLVADTLLAEPVDVPAGAYETMYQAGLTPDSAVEQFTARPATTADAKSLRIASGTPVLVALRTTLDRTGRPVEVVRVVAVARHVSLEYAGLPVRYAGLPVREPLPPPWWQWLTDWVTARSRWRG